MTRRTAIPNRAAVLAAIETLTKTGDQHRPTSVLAVARHLNMANTTLRRHYPDIATDIANSTANPRTQAGGAGESATATEPSETTRLRAENRVLREHLDLAIASIQRLTIQNDQLRQGQPTDSTSKTAARPSAQRTLDGPKLVNGQVTKVSP